MAVASPAQAQMRVSALSARPRRQPQALRRRWSPEAQRRPRGTRSRVDPASPARRHASRNGKCLVGAPATSQANASSSSASPVCVPVSTGVSPTPLVPPLHARLRQAPLRARPRSQAMTRQARARLSRVQAAEPALQTSAWLQAAEWAGAEEAASVDPHSRADRRHGGFPAGRVESRPGHLAPRSSRPNRCGPSATA